MTDRYNMDKKDLMNKLITLYRQLLALLLEQLFSTTKREKLYNFAKSCLGKDMAPVQNEFGCAEAVNNVVFQALGYPAGGDVSTYRMYRELFNSTKFKKVSDPLLGDIILSPTGYGSGKIPNGHVGIVSDGIKIMSNNSSTFLWEENYTFKSWEDRYVKVGGYPVYYFRAI